VRPFASKEAVWRGRVGFGVLTRNVTSAPLSAEAPVRNPLFPKTRSWFALGAPLELMSSLSVMRILYVMIGLLWPVLALAVGVDSSTRIALLTMTAAMGVTWLVLLRVRRLGILAGELLLGGAWLAVAVVASTDHGGLVSVVYLAASLPIIAIAGMFLSTSGLLLQHGLAATTVWIAAAQVTGPFRATVIALAATLALGCCSAVVTLLMRSSRRRNTIDADTGLPNGYGLAARVRAKEWSNYVVTTVALSGLPDVREALGYLVGTELLRRGVEDLGQVMPADALIGRVDGDELVVILPVGPGHSPGGGAAAVDDSLLVAAIARGKDVAAQLVRGIGAGRYLVEGIEISLRGHAGVAAAPWDGDDVAGVVRRASLSARRAVTEGQQCRVWDGERDAMTADDLTLLADLRFASARNELWLAYQPQIDPASGRAEAVESLLRWNSDSRGLVSPGRFIPLAERTGLIDALTDWVLDEALDAQVRWRADGLDLPVSVNISAKAFARPDLAEWVVAKLRHRCLPPSCLTLEVTETAQVNDLFQAVRLLRPLHDLGVRVSIDDFGTGYTSFAMLPELPLDELKVDRSFVVRSATSAADEAIVRSVLELAHRLGITAVAEGVEDVVTQDRMIAYGFDLLQGYHLARPMREQSLLEFVGAQCSSPAARAVVSVASEPSTAHP